MHVFVDAPNWGAGLEAMCVCPFPILAVTLIKQLSKVFILVHMPICNGHFHFYHQRIVFHIFQRRFFSLNLFFLSAVVTCLEIGPLSIIKLIHHLGS